MKRATAALVVVAIAFGIECASALGTLRSALEGGTELDVDL
jgi:hypothetical protein